MKIGSKLRLSFIAVLLPLTLIYCFIIFIAQQEDTEQLIEVELDHIEQTASNLEKRDVQLLGAALEAFCHDPSFKEVYLRKNREELFQYGKPLFEQLKKQYGITHFYFILPDGRCFLRLHNREVYGDVITRSSFRRARETGRAAADIELGKTAFALRVVRPYHFNNELIGYVEFGEEIDHFLSVLKQETGYDYALVAEKEYLDPSKYRFMREVAGLENNWSDQPEHVLLGATSRTSLKEYYTEANLDKLENGQRLLSPIKENAGKYWFCGGILLNDLEGRHLGAILARIDVTDRLVFARQTFLYVLGLAILLLIAALVASALISRWITRPVGELEKAAADVSQGRLDREVDIDSEDELGSLARTFNDMVVQLRESHHRLSKQIRDRQQAEEFVRAILESIGEAIVVIDADYKIVATNTAFAELVGEKKWESFKGRTCYSVQHSSPFLCFEENENIDCPARRTFSSSRPAIAYHTHQKGDGEKIAVEVKAFPMIGSSGEVTAVIEVINDITEKKQLEERLIQSQKMEAIGTLTAGVAHEFNNILTAIMGFAEILKEEVAADSRHGEYVSQIIYSAERAARLTQSMLAFSRKQVIKLEVVDLNDSVRQAVKILEKLVGEDIEIRLEMSDKDIAILGDTVQLQQILMNLVANARDAMPDGGSLVISTDMVRLEEKLYSFQEEIEPGFYGLLRVEDSGRGIDDASLKQVLEPFFTTKEFGRGTGLGLSVVYGIVKQHQGHLEITSEPGVGTSVCIYLPLTEKTGSQSTAPSPTEVRRTGRGETILLAEDEDTVRSMIKWILEQHGYRVLAAENGNKAVKLFQENRAEIDLLLSDIVMPDKSGMEVNTMIQEEKPGTPALFISGYPADYIEKYEIPKDAAFIMKPVKPADLLGKIEELLKKRKRSLK